MLTENEKRDSKLEGLDIEHEEKGHWRNLHSVQVRGIVIRYSLISIFNVKGRQTDDKGRKSEKMESSRAELADGRRKRFEAMSNAKRQRHAGRTEGMNVNTMHCSQNNQW